MHKYIRFIHDFLRVAEKELPVGFPQIVQNPGMKVVEKGRDVVLVCEANGDPAPVISWVRDTVPIITEVRTYDGNVRRQDDS